MCTETEFSTSIHIVVDNYMFHVERLQTEEAAINLFIDISEVQQVGSEGGNVRRVSDYGEAVVPTIHNPNPHLTINYLYSS